MSGPAKTLVAGDRKVRCAANKVYAVAVPETATKLQVTKRTDDLNVVLAEFRKQVRWYPRREAYLFHLPTGKLVYTRCPGWPLADLQLLTSFVNNATQPLQGGRS